MSGNHEETKYLRFGMPPRSSRSFNAIAGKPIAGVSVYEGWLEEEDEEYVETFFVDTSNLNVQGIYALVLLCAIDRPAYFLEGSEVGEGTDGEPLLSVARYQPVPKTTDVTSSEIYARPALELWSRGPRDGSGVKLAQWRLGYHEAGYLSPAMAPFSFAENRRIARAVQGKAATDKKAAKAARKKNRKG